jgi:hypothetical protein
MLLEPVMQVHNLGFSRIGAKRELKFSLEKILAW